MSDYEKVTDGRGVVRYKLDGKFVKASEVPEEVKVSLNEEAQDETPAQEPATQEASEEPTEEAVPTAPEVSEPEEPVDPGASADDAPIDEDDGIDVEETVKAAAPVEEDGMGFKRVNGKTVDIFDGKTPHTHVRFVANIMVPLSKENHDNKTDGEIIAQLKKLGKI